MIPSQMLKGTLEGCILKVISHNETYGYEISQGLKEYGFSKYFRRNNISSFIET